MSDRQLLTDLGLAMLIALPSLSLSRPDVAEPAPLEDSVAQTTTAADSDRSPDGRG